MSHPYATTTASADTPAPDNTEPVVPPTQQQQQQQQRSVEPSASPPPLPPSPPHLLAEPLGDGRSDSADNSRSLPSEADEDAAAEGDSRPSRSKSDTIVSHTDDVSSSSSAASSSSSTSDFSSRSPSRGSASSSSGPRSSGLSACSCDVSNHQSSDDAAECVRHRHRHQDRYRRHHHHRHNGCVHTDPNRQANQQGVSATTNTTVDADAATVASHDEAEGCVGGSAASEPNLAGRVQTSELTRFTQVLAAGGRGSAVAHPLLKKTSRSGCLPGAVDIANVEELPSQRWWCRSGEPPSSPNRTSDYSLSASGNSQVHRYLYVSPTDADAASLSFSTSPPRKPNDEGSEGVAAGPAVAATTSMPNPHTQRPRSAAATAATVIATPPATSTPLPPPHPHPYRSVSAQSRVSNSPMGRGSLHNSNNGGLRNAIKASLTLFSRNSSGCSPPPFLGPDVALPPTPYSNSSASSTPTRQVALRRSSSFTAGMLPPPAVSRVSTEGDGGHPYLISAAASSSAVGTSTSPLLGGRVHERTSSVASSVHSASSSARPSVPLPPSHVGSASNMMAAVWVDLPNSQPASRCATPINSGSEAQQAQQRRRRTTPRRGSEPPSPATSTLAASVASSQEGNSGSGLSASTVAAAAAAALASVRMHYVTVGTQTEVVDEVVVSTDPSFSLEQQQASYPQRKEATTPSPAESLEGHHTPEKLKSEAELMEDGVLRRVPQASAVIVLPPTAASISSTSTEVSPCSLRVGVMEAAFDDAPTNSSTAAPGVTESNAASKSSASMRPLNKACGTGASVPKTLATEASAITATAMTANTSAATSIPQIYRAEIPPSIVPPPSSSPHVPPTTEKECIATQGVNLTAAGIGSTSPSVPVGASHVSLSHSIAKETARQGTSQNLTGRSGSGEVNGGQSRHTSEATTATTTNDAGKAASADVSTTHTTEVQQLRSELALMRTQYAIVLDQLRRMQMKGEGGAATAAEATQCTEDISAVSRSPSSSSSTSAASTLSASLTGVSEASPQEPRSAATSASDADAAATLQHVREALERTRQRTNV